MSKAKKKKVHKEPVTTPIEDCVRYVPSDKRGSQYAQNDSVKLGAFVHIHFRDTMKEAPVMVKAKVVYVHPKRRFYVVEYGNGIREAFIWGCAS